MIRQVDVRDVLPAIHVPALVIQRLDDRITSRCHGRYLADHLPRARYFEQPGCHLPWLDDSEPMLTEIEGFLAGLAREEPEPGIVIRVGVHTGEVDIRAGDIAGVSSQVAARLAAIAEPGEILASRIVRDLVVGSGIAFDDRGERELPGLDGDWAIFAAAPAS